MNNLNDQITLGFLESVIQIFVYILYDIVNFLISLSFFYLDNNLRTKAALFAEFDLVSFCCGTILEIEHRIRISQIINSILWIKGRIRRGGFLRIFTVAFPLFIAPAK